MRTRFKLALAVALTLALSYVFQGAAYLLNVPNDGAFYAGVAVLLAGVVVGPTGYYYIFKEKKTKESHEETTGS